MISLIASLVAFISVTIVSVYVVQNNSRLVKLGRLNNSQQNEIRKYEEEQKGKVKSIFFKSENNFKKIKETDSKTNKNILAFKKKNEIRDKNAEALLKRHKLQTRKDLEILHDKINDMEKTQSSEVRDHTNFLYRDIQDRFGKYKNAKEIVSQLQYNPALKTYTADQFRMRGGNKDYSIRGVQMKVDGLEKTLGTIQKTMIKKNSENLANIDANKDAYNTEFDAYITSMRDDLERRKTLLDGSLSNMRKEILSSVDKKEKALDSALEDEKKSIDNKVTDIIYGNCAPGQTENCVAGYVPSVLAELEGIRNTTSTNIANTTESQTVGIKNNISTLNSDIDAMYTDVSGNVDSKNVKYGGLIDEQQSVIGGVMDVFGKNINELKNIEGSKDSYLQTTNLRSKFEDLESKNGNSYFNMIVDMAKGHDFKAADFITKDNGIRMSDLKSKLEKLEEVNKNIGETDFLTESGILMSENSSVNFHKTSRDLADAKIYYDQINQKMGITGNVNIAGKLKVNGSLIDSASIMEKAAQMQTEKDNYVLKTQISSNDNSMALKGHHHDNTYIKKNSGTLSSLASDFSTFASNSRNIPAGAQIPIGKFNPNTKFQNVDWNGFNPSSFPTAFSKGGIVDTLSGKIPISSFADAAVTIPLSKINFSGFQLPNLPAAGSSTTVTDPHTATGYKGYHFSGTLPIESSSADAGLIAAARSAAGTGGGNVTYEKSGIISERDVKPGARVNVSGSLEVRGSTAKYMDSVNNKICNASPQRDCVSIGVTTKHVDVGGNQYALAITDSGTVTSSIIG